MNPTLGIQRFRLAVAAIATAASVAPSALAQVFFPFGSDHLTVGQSDGPNGDGRIYVGDYSLFGGDAPCHYRLDLLPGSGVVYDVKVCIWHVDARLSIPGVLYTRDGKLHFTGKTAFDLVDRHGDPCNFAARNARSTLPEGSSFSINISNDADAFDLSCDGRFAVVVGSNSATPIVLVDLTSQAEVASLTYDGLARSVAACDDGQSVLVVLDNEAGTASEIRRLIIGSNGTLTDTGESFPFGGMAYISKVFAVPGSQVGLAFITIVGLTTTSELVAFRIPGLQMLDMAQLGMPIGNAAAVSCSGTKVYVRSGSRGPNADVIEGFMLDPMTGALGDTPSPTISNVSFVNVPVYANPLGLSRDGTVLIAAEPAFIPTPEYPSPQLTYFNANTGERVAKLEEPGLMVPGTVATVPCCLAPAPLLNISTRGEVRTDNDVMIAGFIISGNAPKQIIARAIGPSLSGFGVPGALQDPMLELHDTDGALIAMNDNWRDSQQAKIFATGLAPSNDLESAILRNLSPASYTAVVRGTNNTTGVGLVEVYDLSPESDSTLANESTRGFVGADDNAVIGGIIVGGAQNSLSGVVIRAIGPSLAASGVPDPLVDPTLEIHDGNGVQISFNDNWRETQESEIIVTGLAPTNDLESTVVLTTGPGNYTAVVRGKNNTTGVGLVEIYHP